MRLDELPRSRRVEDRRGQGGGFHVPGGRGGGVGIGLGTLIILGLIGWALGIDPSILIRGADTISRTQPPPAPERTGPTTAGTPGDQVGQLVSAVLGSTEVQWKKILAQHGKDYVPPTLVMFSGDTLGLRFRAIRNGAVLLPARSQGLSRYLLLRGSGTALRACDAGSKSCQFSQAYVITHEVGHHVQNLLGILPRVQQMQKGMDQAEANHLQVRVELQADCYAGLWAHHSQKDWAFIEEGDVEAAMQTASAIGDDRLQRRSQGYVVPDAFTHGSSAQRTRWFMTGLKSGALESCDTFGAAQL